MRISVSALIFSQPGLKIHKSTVCPGKGCRQTAVLKGSTFEVEYINKCKAFEGNDIDTATSEVEVKQCVNKCKAFEGNDTYSVDNFTWESDIKFWEIETDSLSSQITNVKGQLRKKLKFWQEVLKAPNTVPEYIENGYRLLFKFLPPSHNQCNNKLTETHQQFVDEAVHSLLANRSIRKVEAEPWVCCPLSVVSNCMGKLRLVLDL